MTTMLYDVMGPVAQKKIRTGTRWAVVALLVLAAIVLYLLGSNGQLNPNIWSVLLSRDLAILLLKGAWATLLVAAASILLSVGFGVLLAGMRLSERIWVRIPVRIWVEIFRGLPLLVLIFFIFFGAPALGINVSTFWALVIAISLYNSAVMSEIFRAGIRSLPKGQTEAGMAIGLSSTAAFRMILMPQAIRYMLPSLITQLIIILKESSLGFVIGYTELLRSGRIAAEYLGGAYALPIYVAIALVYLAVNLSLAKVARKLEGSTA